MSTRRFDFKTIFNPLTVLTSTAFFCLFITVNIQAQSNTSSAVSELKAPLLPIVAVGCGLILVEQTEPGGTKFLQAFELEDGSSFEPEINELVRTLSTELTSEGTGRNTYQRYLSRLETTPPANMKDYQFLQMETAAGILFRARQEAFMSIFPDQNMDIQVDSIMSLCPDIEGLEEALLLLE